MWCSLSLRAAGGTTVASADNMFDLALPHDSFLIYSGNASTASKHNDKQNIHCHFSMMKFEHKLQSV